MAPCSQAKRPPTWGSTRGTTWPEASPTRPTIVPGSETSISTSWAESVVFRRVLVARVGEDVAQPGVDHTTVGR